MTPREIAAALDADPIAGLTHGLGYTTRGWSDAVEVEPCLTLTVERADVTIYLNHDDLSGVFATAGRLKTKEFWVRPETLRADLVEILAWSLNANHPDPAAPETITALRTPGLYGEVLRRHLTDRRDVLKALDFPQHRPLVAALTAALKETSC